MDPLSLKDDLLSRLMSATTQRSRVIASNIANQNTPGYRRQVLRFEELLQDALHTGRSLERVVPSLEEDLLTPARADGNNVNLEGRFELMRSSIESGR
jgi:flagellar basal-body rod protein FlgB